MVRVPWCGSCRLEPKGGSFSWNFSRLIRAGKREVSWGGSCVGENVDELACRMGVGRRAWSVLWDFNQDAVVVVVVEAASSRPDPFENRLIKAN